MVSSGEKRQTAKGGEPVEETHQVTRGFTGFVHELLSVLLPDSDQELVDAHRTAVHRSRSMVGCSALAEWVQTTHASIAIFRPNRLLMSTCFIELGA